MDVLWIIIIIIFLVVLKFYFKFTSKMCTCDVKMIDKVVIVTGANTGIGYETAKDMARRGARVILACRSREMGEEARDKIIKATGNDNVVFKQLNLTSFKSVRAFVDDVLKVEQKIDVLINNAGMPRSDNSLTDDNVVVEAQVNHFSPFLLTMLLLPALKRAAPSRIVNVSSVLHRLGKIDVDNFHKQAKNQFVHCRMYFNTKLANLLFTIKLSRYLQGTGVTANCLHPGSVNTRIFRDNFLVVKFFVRLFFKNAWEGAQTSIHLAVSPKLIHTSGKYFSNCREVVPSKDGQDYNLADKLWELSEKVVDCPINI